MPLVVLVLGVEHLAVGGIEQQRRPGQAAGARTGTARAAMRVVSLASMPCLIQIAAHERLAAFMRHFFGFAYPAATVPALRRARTPRSLTPPRLGSLQRQPQGALR